MRQTLSFAAIFGALLLAGCASLGDSSSAAFTPEARCERGGGWWHPYSNYCEPIVPGSPS